MTDRQIGGNPVAGYYGAYRAIVVDNKDPKNLRRVRVQVPQVTQNQKTDWVWPMISTKRPPAIGAGVLIFYVGGNVDYPLWVGEFGKDPQGIFCHGAWHNTETMTAALTNTVYPMQCNVTDISKGVKMVDLSKMTPEQGGSYNIQFSAQFDKANASLGYAHVWLRKNGVDIPFSASRLAVQGSTAEFIASWNWFVEAKVGDYFEVVGSVTDTNVYLPAFPASGEVPGVPSVILTMTQVA